MTPSLNGRKIVITGGASGIGFATAEMAASTGAKVIALDLQTDLLEQRTQENKAKDLDIVFRMLDITDQQGVVDEIDWIVSEFGAVDGLVCSAGSSDTVTFLDLKPDQWARLIDLNLTGTFFISQQVAKAMVAAGTGGSIVTVSSARGVTGKGSANYAASKAGVIGLTKSMALDLAQYGIRVNSAAPGPVDTPLMRRITSGESLRQVVPGNSPLGRLGQPDDIAHGICFLLSEEASWITGQTLHINGGTTLI